ncbi:MAG: EcsC family protein, partial [Paracoccaceae bacterium]|nr:EcsC family protein [Paracoccaceae bacterium]
ALEKAYGLASRGPELGGHRGMAAVLASGAAGGAGGIATAIAELPVTVTLILNAIRAEARAAGLDPDAPDVREVCLRVFGAGSPLASDDGINTSFLTARLSITGQAMQNLISAVAPRLAAALGPKLAAQAVPVLGAVSGAALNAAFLAYYREIARIRFALLRLEERHGSEAVLAAFRAAVAPPRVIRA